MSGRIKAKDTQYNEDEAEYDACEFNFQIVESDGDNIIALFGTREERDHVMRLLAATPFPS